MLLLFGRYQAG